MPPIVKSGHLALSAAFDLVADINHSDRREAQQTLRQLLYDSRVPSQIIERSGQTSDVPAYVWGGHQWREVLRTGRVSFNNASYSSDVHGRVIISEVALKTALTPCEAATESTKQNNGGDPPVIKKTETRLRDEQIYSLFNAISAANPLAKRAQIFEKMRVELPDLFMNRREAVPNTQISNQRIERIIREQQR